MIFSKKDRKKETYEPSEPRLGWGWIAIYIFAAVSLIIYITAIFSESFANFFTRYPAAAVRAVLSYITYLLPISLAEILLILLIPAVIAVLVIAYRRYCDTWKSVLIFAVKLISVAAIIFSLFVWTLGTGYRTTPLGERLGLGSESIDKEDITETCVILIGLINGLEDEIVYAEDGFSEMPYSYDEMSKKLMTAYGALTESYDFIPSLYSRVKPVMLSELMTYTHIAGVYSYFTGEANINVTFPDYTLPYTAAHELAHQRGISREDEANFIAFLVCSESDDPYIRYSGYVSMLEYLLNAHYSADQSEEHADYKALYSTLSDKVRTEQKAYYDFYQKYADNIAASVSGAVNNSYLQSQGTAGTVSYSLAVELAVRYFAKSIDT